MVRAKAVVLLYLFLQACAPSPPVSPVEALPGGALHLRLSSALAIELAGMSFRVLAGGAWVEQARFAPPEVRTEGGEITVTYGGGPAPGPERLVLRLRLPESDPGATRLQVQLQAAADRECRFEALELVVPPGALSLPGLAGNLLFLQNGYQSWSFTGVVNLAAPFISPRTSAAESAFLAGSGDPLQELFGVGWWFGLLASGPDRPLLVVGAASARRLRTAIAPELPEPGGGGLALRLGTAGEQQSIPAAQGLELEEVVFAPARTPEEGLASYAAVVAEASAPLREQPVPGPTGWWSWNSFFAQVTERDILEQAVFLKQNLQRHGFQLLMIDDGYASLWGEWRRTDPRRFPAGIEALARQVSAEGLTPGLWLAPFLVDERSSLATDHPGWFVKEPDGAPLRLSTIGFPGIMHVLDGTNPEVHDHLADLFRALQAAGFGFFKLDFLYAGAVAGVRREPGVTGIEALGRGLEQIRAAVPGAHLNLCGMPILPAVGRGHSLRLGADIAFSGIPHGFTQLAHEARNVIVRSFLDPLIRSDPDQVLLQEPLTMDEARVAATLAAMTGFYTAGDALTALPAERLALLTDPDLLALARAGRSARPLDLLDGANVTLQLSPLLDLGGQSQPKTHLPSRFFLKLSEGEATLALFNWSASAQQATVSLAPLGHQQSRVEELWSKQTLVHDAGSLTVAVAPHGVALLRLRAP